ncbi:MAG: 6-carboxytetrahydropterin synthase [Chloroflexales bacterium]|nr:6-carboxytetrahydropterin synthase [Chloroflexales bacterium]
MGTFQIHVEKDYLGFCAAHFITYDGHQCEMLHGHNYRVRIDIEGAVDENFYVLDFTRVKHMMKRLCDELDHRMLLPLYNSLLELEYSEDSIAVRYKQRRFVFPREDVVLLPIANTTAEMLAQHICRRALEELGKNDTSRLTAITVEVEESIGQSATYREQLPL